MAIGTFTFVATLFHPMKAAEQFAVIDNLSKGRLYTTMSRGYHPGYWQQFGIPQEHLLGRFQEAIRIWLKAFEGERFDFPGKYWQVEQGLLAPQPYQPGGWPIWGGGHAATAGDQALGRVRRVHDRRRLPDRPGHVEGADRGVRRARPGSSARSRSSS